MINGVLVERTVQDVTPALQTNSEGLKKVLEELVKQYKKQQEEMERWKASLPRCISQTLLTSFPCFRKRTTSRLSSSRCQAFVRNSRASHSTASLSRARGFRSHVTQGGRSIVLSRSSSISFGKIMLASRLVTGPVCTLMHPCPTFSSNMDNLFPEHQSFSRASSERLCGTELPWLWLFDSVEAQGLQNDSTQTVWFRGLITGSGIMQDYVKRGQGGYRMG